MFRRSRAPLALLFAAVPAFADDTSAAAPAAHKPLEEVIVTASPLQQKGLETAQPTAVLTGDDLRRQVAVSIGETVSSQLGVSSSYFGPVASRPVIRGLGGDRVEVLDDGLGSLDASGLSPDHAVTVESSLAQQVEIVKGPAALLYGSQAAGGVVNVASDRIPTAQPENGFSGSFETRGDSALDERALLGGVTAGAGAFVAHAEGFRRVTDDVRIPGTALSDALRARLLAAGAPRPVDEPGRIANTASRAAGGSLGASWLGDAGYLGLAFSKLDNAYGLPGEETAYISMDQRRWDLKGQWNAPAAGLANLRVRAAYNDYTHTEFEGPGEPGTLFLERTSEVRMTTDHEPLAGWRGSFGFQYVKQDFAAIGAEAFVPPSITRDLGVFGYEERAFGPLTAEFGLRLERRRIDVSDAAGVLPDYSGSGVSASAGLLWSLSADYAASLNLTRTQRQPSSTELYADGPHGAVQRFEIGAPELRKESANTVDVGLRRRTGPLRWLVSLYLNDYSDYVYEAATGALDPASGFPIYRFAQADARFHGAEAELTAPLWSGAAGELSIRIAGDVVRAKLADGGNLPLIPPWRLGVGLDYDREALHAGLSAYRYGAQNRVPVGELPTAGYTMVDADVSRGWPLARGRIYAFLQGSNLLDRVARQNASVLKDVAPLPGRGARLGVRLEW